MESSLASRPLATSRMNTGSPGGTEEDERQQYQRVTSKLASAAWGCEAGQSPPNPPPKVPLKLSPASAFDRSGPHQALLAQSLPVSVLTADGDLLNNMSNYNRTSKVSKTSYEDHGDHSSSGSGTNSPARTLISSAGTANVSCNSLSQGGEHHIVHTSPPKSQPENTKKHFLDEDVMERISTGDGEDYDGGGTDDLDTSSNQNGESSPAHTPNSNSNSNVRQRPRHQLLQHLTVNVNTLFGKIRTSKSNYSAKEDVDTEIVENHDNIDEPDVPLNLPVNRHDVIDLTVDEDTISHHDHGNDQQQTSTHTYQNNYPAVTQDSPLQQQRQANTSTQKQTTSVGSTKGRKSSHYRTRSTSGGKPPTSPAPPLVPPGDPNKNDKPKCFTSPSKPCTNAGLDNSEGNLIVNEHDIFHIPNSSFCHLTRDSNLIDLSTKNNAGSTQFQVLDLLGQGTFAQVFHCVNVSTGESLAVKIVKNKPAYTRQAAVEIDIFKSLLKNGGRKPSATKTPNASNTIVNPSSSQYPWVNLECYFFYQNHLCLVFELLGCNLYEVLKKRQFRGLPLGEVKSIIKQSLVGMKRLSELGIVHCDVKPENILLVDSKHPEQNSKDDMSVDCHAEAGSHRPKGTTIQIKIIDFGSASFEGQTSHTYIQSRFYRSPEVLVGLPYDAAIDMWSLGCVAAELYLGLPILPGMHEHDQLGRIVEMIGDLPDWMIERGTKTNKYYVKADAKSPRTRSSSKLVTSKTTTPPLAPQASATPSAWRLKTREEYAATLPANQRANDLQVQNTNRYFKRKKLEDIVTLHGHVSNKNNLSPDTVKQVAITLNWFIHFLKGMLDPDPWKRWTAQQALNHPFLSDKPLQYQGNSSGLSLDELVWSPPWDPAICQRKLRVVDKTRDIYKTQKQQTNSTLRRKTSQSGMMSPGTKPANREPVKSPEFSTSSVISMTDAMSLRSGSQQQYPQQVTTQPKRGGVSPPSTLGAVPVGSHRYARQHSAHASTYNTAVAYSPYVNQPPAGLQSQLSQYLQQVMPSGQPYSAAASQAQHGMYNIQHPAGMTQHGHTAIPTADYNLNSSAYFGSLPPYVALASAQSFTGGALYYDGLHQIPLQGDLGHALTRPGVVPGYANNGEFMQHQTSPQRAGYGRASPNTLLRSTSYGAYGYSPHTSVRSTPSNNYHIPPTPPAYLANPGAGTMMSASNIPTGSNHNSDAMNLTPSSLSESFRHESRRLSDPMQAHLEDEPTSIHSADLKPPAVQGTVVGGGIGSLLSQQLAQHENGSSSNLSAMSSQPQQQQQPGKLMQQQQHLQQQPSFYNQLPPPPSSSYNVLYQTPANLAPYSVNMNLGNIPVGSAGAANAYYNAAMVSGMSAPDLAGPANPHQAYAQHQQPQQGGIGGALMGANNTGGGGIGGMVMNHGALAYASHQVGSLGNNSMDLSGINHYSGGAGGIQMYGGGYNANGQPLIDMNMQQQMFLEQQQLQQQQQLLHRQQQQQYHNQGQRNFYR